MKTKWYITAVSILAAIFGLPLIIIGLVYQNQVMFNPVDFINEYLDFAIGLVAMIVAFGLNNVYWANKLRQERVNQSRRVITRFFHRLQDLVTQCEELLAQQYQDVRKSHARDEKVIALFAQMGLTKEGLLIHYPEQVVEQDDQLTHSMVDLFWTHIAPAINNLGTRQAIRGELDEIRPQLQILKEKTAEALQLLSAGKNWTEASPQQRK